MHPDKDVTVVLWLLVSFRVSELPKTEKGRGCLKTEAKTKLWTKAGAIPSRGWAGEGAPAFIFGGGKAFEGLTQHMVKVSG